MVRTRKKKAAVQKVVPLIAPEVQNKMDYLRSFYSPGQLQLHFQSLLDGLPFDMSVRERTQRIEACKALGYRDLNKKRIEDDEL